mmetsp:Transcript_28671/g.39603  ORF Transcript_28671/g.39603 Transcript_28671/m.39603 type:complete len:195 (+) Transcript_28671:29-613(+)|eukprot:CAMPEP_0196584306 /NCGR_PEP_ID=MMETSP1081-20130531/46611_1 /TAXON_ID=36882 /ORGANISM="Pyramimonas amylifera, Strain CCMP720" /LENGTH=194 /DNA_ID=CAMNT_0041905467 /DNA_START=22 /DNA_END=606 /DNA_ORIENTATION=-
MDSELASRETPFVDAVAEQHFEGDATKAMASHAKKGLLGAKRASIDQLDSRAGKQSKGLLIELEASKHKLGFDASVSLEDLRAKMQKFASEREWEQFHTPRNLLLALVGEMGELSEIFQWRGECAPGLTDWSEKDKAHLGEELSDVLLYLVRLSDVCGVDLANAAENKIEKNTKKYPAEKCRGSSAKYTRYQQA